MKLKLLTLSFAALTAYAQTAPTVVISPTPKLQFLDNSGRPLAGGCVATYQAGTTTPLQTFTDATGMIPNQNPVMLDSAGRAGIWISVPSIKYVVKQKSGSGCSLTQGTVITTTDNIQDSGLRLRSDLAGPGGAGNIGYQPPGGTVPGTISGALGATALDMGYSTFAQACASASGAPKTLTGTKAWNGLTTMTCAAHIQPTVGFMVQPLSGATVTLPCPASVPFQVFDVSLGGAIRFSQACEQNPLDVRMFGFSAGAADNGPALAAARAAFTTLGAVSISLPQGSFTHTTAQTLAAGIPEHWRCAASSSTVTGGGAAAGGTILAYSGMGSFLTEAATDYTANFVVDNCTFQSTGASTGAWTIGSTAQNAAGLYRQNWVLNNVTFNGPGGSVAGSVGVTISICYNLQLNNVLFIDYERPLIMDRCSVSTGNPVFQNYTLPPWITVKAGTGGVAGYTASVTWTNPQFDGPGVGAGQCSVLVDAAQVTFIGALYEPTTATPACWIHVTGQGGSFRDVNGFMSGTLPPNSFIWDDGYTDLAFIGTNCTVAPCPPSAPGTRTREHTARFRCASRAAARSIRHLPRSGTTKARRSAARTRTATRSG